MNKKDKNMFIEEDIYDWYIPNEKRKEMMQTVLKRLLNENEDLLTELAKQ